MTFTLAGLKLDRPRIMGVLNATPDSFSDGGVHDRRAADRIAEMVAQGAAIVDIGGESTRPGADFIAADEEWRCIDPALRAAAGTGAVVSVDTRKAEVAMKALALGARIFNDVSALSFDPESLAAARAYAEAGGAVCVMHAQGDPKTMQKDPHYADVVREVRDYLESRVALCESVGIERRAVIVDPGIGFGKTLAHNLALLKGLSVFADMGCPLLLGVSRKRFIGALSGESDAARRAPGSIAAGLWGAQAGARILRVHDVAETAQALSVWEAIA